MIWDTIKDLWKNRIPGQLVIQITDICNARCPQCGMRVTETFSRSRISQDHIRQIIDAAVPKGIQAISFTGGEPFLILDDLVEMIRYAGDAGIPYIRTGTNGFIFRGSHKSDFCARMKGIAGKLADTTLRNLWISIDSAVPELHENMRGLSGVIDGIRKALPIFHRYGIYPSANMGINRNLVEKLSGDFHDPLMVYHHYRSGFERFYQMVCDLGFTTVNCCYPMSIDATESKTGLSPVYAATATDNLVNFSLMEQLLLYRALFDTIPQYRSRIRIFTPRTSLLALLRQLTGHCHEPRPCRGGIDFFFIDAQKAHVWPCGYRGGEDLGPFPDLNPADLL
ncbi:MAG TPA: radical SAM protein, partial [Desulfatirhabdiaceae bacterium]|nr:radical SAM protein [Desulfatirhabdiaceae bacterium]